MTQFTQILIVAIAPSTIAATGSLIVNLINRKKLDEIHVMVNSRLTELLDSTRTGSIAQGRQDERDNQAHVKHDSKKD